MAWIYGHRGASCEYPENTLASFQRALALGVDALEMDVHLTLDGHVVVSHDESGRRMANVPKEIRHTPLRDVLGWDVGFGYQNTAGQRPFCGAGFRIPTLADVLHHFPSTFLNIDIKQRTPQMEAVLVQQIRDQNAEARVRLCSFHDDVLSRVRALGYRGPLALGPRDLRKLWVTPIRILRAGLVRIVGDAAQVPLKVGPLRFASPFFIDKCHTLGIRVDFWTINDVHTAKWLVELQADGIMTDDPGGIIGGLRGHPPLPAGPI